MIKSLEDLDLWNKTRLKRFVEELNPEEPVQCSNLYGGNNY